jgi:hypothetical protein
MSCIGHERWSQKIQIDNEIHSHSHSAEIRWHYFDCFHNSISELLIDIHHFFGSLCTDYCWKWNDDFASVGKRWLCSCHCLERLLVSMGDVSNRRTCEFKLDPSCMVPLHQFFFGHLQNTYCSSSTRTRPMQSEKYLSCQFTSRWNSHSQASACEYLTSL